MLSTWVGERVVIFLYHADLVVFGEPIEGSTQNKDQC